MRAFPPLKPADLTCFAGIATAAAPLDPGNFLELTARVTCGEIDATLTRAGDEAWRLFSLKARARAICLQEAA